MDARLHAAFARRSWPAGEGPGRNPKPGQGRDRGLPGGRLGEHTQPGSPHLAQDDGLRGRRPDPGDLRRLPDRRIGDLRHVEQGSAVRAAAAEGGGAAAEGAGDRRRHVGLAGRYPAQPGGRPVRDRRSQCRRGRHLAGEHLSRLPGGQLEPHVQLLLRAEPRLAAALLAPAGTTFAASRPSTT